MKTFHHGGRIGDCLYACYTIKALGGGKLYLSPYHTPNWGLEQIQSLKSFLEYQDYITEVEVCDPPRRGEVVKDVDYDLHRVEDIYNPQDFPEWHGNYWPGNIHIAKRYAVGFGVEWDKNDTWLRAPSHGGSPHIVFHAPERRMVRPREAWGYILRSLAHNFKIDVVGGPDDYIQLKDIVPGLSYWYHHDFHTAAGLIGNAKVFLGCASSCNVVAEGIKKIRYVELADGCDNTNPLFDVTTWSDDKIVERVTDAIRAQG